jgi:hypothetical protein
LNLLWAADIYLSSLDRPQPFPLLDAHSAAGLVSEAPMIEIKSPLLLNCFQRVEDTEKR